MRVKTVPNSWIQREGRRLDYGSYMSGVIQAKIKIESLSSLAIPLNNVASYLVSAGCIKGTRIDNLEHGHRFLSSKDILQTDLSNLRFISNRAIKENPESVK